MSKSNIEDYLQQGIHGQKETKPEERRKFLGTLRERIVIALTQNQVREQGVYKEVETALKENPKAHLSLNGNIEYETLSKYIKKAAQYKTEYTIVTDKEHDTDIGLVLAYDYAIDKNGIYVIKKDETPAIKEKPNKKGFFSLFRKG